MPSTPQLAWPSSSTGTTSSPPAATAASGGPGRCRARCTRSGSASCAEARFICPQWPEEFGGKGLDAVRVAVFNEELYRAGVPRVVRGMGESLVGPSVIVHGTPEQQAHFLPRIISGEDVYCQGFSEPGTGSDLAGLQTKGEIDGDEIVITGQKLWTSGAARANKMFVLCRTDPAAEKHAGISFVLIDFTDPAVTYQPVRQMSGAAEFCEDFLDGVRAPLFNVIGGLNNGWRVAMTTLGYERGGSARRSCTWPTSASSGSWSRPRASAAATPIR